MDGKRFDDITRRLGSGLNRRQMLRGLLGGAGAVVATTVVRSGAVAMTPGTACTNPTQIDDCGTPTTGLICQSNQCTCPSGQTFSGTECEVSTTTTSAPTTTTAAPTTTTAAPTTTTAAPTTTTSDPGGCTQQGGSCEGVGNIACCAGLICVPGQPDTCELAPTTTTFPPGDDDDDDDDDDLCGEFGEGCGLNVNGTFPAAGDLQFNCCDGLVCCDVEYNSGGGGFLCAECCNDYGCPAGHKCCDGFCSDVECCRDEHCDFCEVCGQGTCELIGGRFGDTCGAVTILSGGSPQLDCCDGLVCCRSGGGDDDDDDDDDSDNINGAFCAECCGDWDCPKGSECRHGVCQFQCSHDKDCHDGTCCCKSGHCSKHCCDFPDDDKKPVKPGVKQPDAPAVGGVKIETLPSTGIGDDQTSAGWLGAAALGAAAAYIASKKLQDDAPEPEAAEE